MSEIQNQNINSGISSLGQIGKIGSAPSIAQENNRLGMYIDNVLGNEGVAKQNSMNLDAVMSGCLSGYLGLGEKAFDGLENPLASTEILQFGKPQNIATMQALQPVEPALQSKASETLVSFEAPEINEMALGLVPGIGVNVADLGSTNPLAVKEVSDKMASTLQQNDLKQNMAMVNFETLSNWEMDIKGEMAKLENMGTGALAMNNSPQETLAINIKQGESFDAMPIVSKPIIEGNRQDYGAAWNQLMQVHDTLARYDNTGNNGLVGMTDWLGQPNSVTSGIGYNQTIPPSTIGFTYVPPVKELMSHNSIINRELFGFLDMTTYSQSASTGVNPSDVFAYLRPGKYMSNLIDGYYT